MNAIAIKAGAAAVAVALALGANPGRAAGVPPIHKSGAVEYMSGGVGKDESSIMESIGKHWPLTLEFAVKSGQRADFAADVKIAVHDAKGRMMLRATAGGPFFLARLAPGLYTVDATLAGKTLKETVDIKDGKNAKAVFVWPPGTDGTHA